jgi:hypothetical protein
MIKLVGKNSSRHIQDSPQKSNSPMKENSPRKPGTHKTEKLAVFTKRTDSMKKTASFGSEQLSNKVSY